MAALSELERGSWDPRSQADSASVGKAINCQAGLREEVKVTPAGAEIWQEADRRESPFLPLPTTFLPPEKMTHRASWQSQIVVGRVWAPASHRLGLEQKDK